MAEQPALGQQAGRVQGGIHPLASLFSPPLLTGAPTTFPLFLRLPTPFSCEFFFFFLPLPLRPELPLPFYLPFAFRLSRSFFSVLGHPKSLSEPRDLNRAFFRWIFRFPGWSGFFFLFFARLQGLFLRLSARSFLFLMGNPSDKASTSPLSLLYHSLRLSSGAAGLFSFAGDLAHR